MNKLNKKAQVSEAIPWVVSTLIILTFLSLTLLFTSTTQKDKLVYYSKTSDIFFVKSAVSYLLTPYPNSTSVLVYEQLKKDPSQFQITFDEQGYVLFSDLIFMNLYYPEKYTYDYSFRQDQSKGKVHLNTINKGYDLRGAGVSYLPERFPYTLDEIILTEDKILAIYKSYLEHKK